MVFAFACNAKSFTITRLVFLFFLLVCFSGRITKSVLANILRLVIKKACGQDLTHSLNVPKNISEKIVPEVVICDTCCTWHGLCTVTQHPKKQKKQPEIGNKLASRWQKIQRSKQREIKVINKEVWRKRKEKMFKTRKWLLLHLNNIKTVVEEHISTGNVYLPIFY